MARRLIWSPRSLAELDEIAAYIAKDAPLYARKVVSRFEVRAMDDISQLLEPTCKYMGA